MYRFLLTRRWVGGLALAVAAAVACVLLGTWQWGRHEARVARNALVVANYDREPVDADQVLRSGPGWRLPVGATWTPVRLVGRYDPDGTVLLRNRPLDGASGYHVLVPLETADGRRLLVDRGWLPAGEDGDRPDAVPAPPSGQVEAVVRLRPPEEASDRDAPAGQTYRIVPAALPSDAGAGGSGLVTGAYGELAGEVPEPAEAPVLLPRPELEEGPHLSYALQWVMFALLALVGFGVVARRTAIEDAELTDAHLAGAHPADVPPAPGGRSRASGRRGRFAANRTGREQPTDEEVEDAAVHAASVRDAERS